MKTIIIALILAVSFTACEKSNPVEISDCGCNAMQPGKEKDICMLNCQGVNKTWHVKNSDGIIVFESTDFTECQDFIKRQVRPYQFSITYE